MKYIILCGGIEDGNNYSLPKPLNYIYGKHMIEYVIENIHSDEIFIIYNIFLDGYNFKEIIINKFKKKTFHFSSIDYLTRGPLETAYIGCQQFQKLMANNNEENIVFIDDDNIHNLFCLEDKTFETPFIGYNKDESCNIDLSFIKIDEKMSILIEIKEKTKISNLYCCGIYGFNNIEEFLKYSNLLLKNNKTNGEFYFSALYDSILNEYSNIVRAVYIEKTQHIGSFKFTDISVDVKKPKLRICFDLDNTLVTYPTIINDYNSVKPIEKNINLLNFLRGQGHEIIIYTARRMTTHNNNIGKVIKDIALTTINTLEKFNIQYDELIFGKPIADIYIDDRALNPYINNISHYGFFFGEEDFLHNKIDNNKYNIISLVDNRIIKTGPSQFIRGELFYYQNIPQKISAFFPKLFHSSINAEIGNTTIEIEHVKGVPLYYLYKNKLITPKIIDDLFTVLNTLHSLSICDTDEPSDENIKNNYFEKLKKRFMKKEDYPFEDATIVYNEVMKGLYETYSPSKALVTHGDFWFSNIILTYEDTYKMIDMKGQVDGLLTLGGDRYYDYGKFYQSILGYDLILNGCKMDYSYIKCMNDYFISKCDSLVLNVRYLKYVTKSLIFGTFHSIDKPIEIKNNIWALLKSIE
jgi:capsule biosynthesis phosphatase